ncbi:ECF-type sigma factor [Aliikangiella coralliicola]|uniref:Sigma-70 family RNA polymerase sigma factor n=1 Tax=Aliikangiella coralliicola TaxID=2592383 RepID=A0A545U8Z3_9GAMM|nr:ECF-type sigma factor [Aliikangiella coralliicola]TQV85941.1 sigma-70 family RNA polymerase sigma factor [Aliikangiella coralliicola]
MADIGQVTQLLVTMRDSANREQNNAKQALVEQCYAHLHRDARRFLSAENKDHTLQVTELVNEAYLKLFDRTSLNWNDRHHFFASAAIAMRRILVDHARRKLAGNRIPSDAIVSHEADELSTDCPEPFLIALDDSLNELKTLNPRHAEIAMLRYFGGLSESEIAESLNISRSTVTREWRMAKLWLQNQIEDSLNNV